MSKFITILLVLIISQICFAQHSEVTDVSSDGKLSSTYILDSSNPAGQVVRTADDIPFGNTPDWTSNLERQIGGMAWADYDDDGDLDLATGCYFSQSYPPIPNYEVLIYRNDDGVLTSDPVWISSDMKSTTDIRFADLNGDGRPELLAANGDQSLVESVIYFNGSGGLSTTPGWLSQDNNWTVGAAFGDIDGDRDLDLVFGNQGNTTVPTRPICVFTNSAGAFSTIPDWFSADEMITNTVAFGDLDNQQVANDAVEFTADGNSYTFPIPLFPIYSIDSVLINNIQYSQYCYDQISGWISLGTKPSAGTNIKVVYRYIARGDLAASKWVNYESGVYYNAGIILSNLPGWTVGNTQSQKGIAWADFDQDGYQDLAIAGSSVQTVVYKNVNGSLTGPIWTSNTTNPSAQELITGDIDNDGYPELAVVHFGSRKVEVFKNNSGVLDATATWEYSPTSSATSISFGDVNGDGFLDLAVGTARAPVVVFINQSLPVPVELISFNAVLQGDEVNLYWSTASELNNYGFEIERMNSPLQGGESGMWEKIGFVEGDGTTNNLQNYHFTDYIGDMPGNTLKYRLKQIDFDGSYNYSKEVAVTNNLPTKFALEQNYPNPFNPTTTIKYSIPDIASGFSLSNVTLILYDVLGRDIATLVNETKPAGNYEIVFDGTSLSAGIYFYKLSLGEYSETKKMMILK